MHLPEKAVHARLAAELLGRPDPVRRYREGRIWSGQRIGARVAAHDLAALVLDLKRHRSSSAGANVVIDHCSIGWVFTCSFVGWNRRITIGVPADPQSRLRMKQHCRSFRDRRLKLSQRRDVVENPEPPAVRGDPKVVALNNQIANRDGAHIEARRIPAIADIQTSINTSTNTR